MERQYRAGKSSADDDSPLLPADSTETVRAYVIAPAATNAQDFTFLLTSLDKQAERDTGDTRFAAPGDAP